MKKLLLSSPLFILSFQLFSQIPDWQWGRYATGQGTQETFNCATDPSGNAYLAGNFQNDVTFGTTTMTLFGLGMFLAKFDAAGNLIWLRVAGGLGSNGIYQCTTDDDANIYITGRYANSITIGQFTLTNVYPTVTHIFIAKYDSSGNVLWARSAGELGTNPDMAWTVHVDNSSNVYISGNIQTDTIPLDSDTLFAEGGSLFLIKYDSSGTELWSRNIPCVHYGLPQYIASDNNANLYITGFWFGDSLLFPGSTFYNNGPPGLYEIFICSFDSAGNFRWGKSYGGDNMDHGYGVACDNANNVYLTGDFSSSTITLDSYNITNVSGQYNYFIAKYDPMGNMLWLKSDSGQSAGYCIITDDANDLYWSGRFYSTDVVIDSITLQRPPVYYDPSFVAKLDSSGNVYWAKALASGGDDNNGLALGVGGDIFLGGDFYGVSPFIIGNDSLILTGTENAFIAKLGFTNLVALFNSPDNVICPGTCTDFNNNSVNATSYQWYFPGSSTPSSTDINPSNICYNTPGQYDVTLIASGAAGIDTLTLLNYITVYPAPPAQGILQSGDTLFANAGAVSYQWYFNNNLIPGATNYFYVAPASGDYNVVATDGNGCEVEAVINDVIAGLTPTLSKGEGVTAFPNPVNESLSVICYSRHGGRALSGIANPEISVYNMLGEKTLMPDILFSSGAEVELDVSALHPGMYVLEIKTGENIIRTKFLKE